MWRLWHILFGWDYIYWSNICDQGVRRVYKTKEGKPYYIRYTITNLYDEIKTPNQVLWLTCSSNKYFNGQVFN